MIETAPRHSVAHEATNPEDKRQFAPAAARNTGPIIEAMRPWVPAGGLALEIASGTGEHAVAFTDAFPDLRWQPTEIDEARLASISAWKAHARAQRIEAPQRFDAAKQGWSGPKADLVFLSNLLHIVSDAHAQAIIDTMAEALAPSGVLAIYGPFLRETGYASEGDERFDAAIRAQNPDAGYKSIEWVEDHFQRHQLTRCDCLAMPANNLLMVWMRPA